VRLGVHDDNNAGDRDRDEKGMAQPAGEQAKPEQKGHGELCG
jgi:hypothetical protein